MKVIAVILCLGTFAGAQVGVRYDNRVVTVASNVPVGANAPVLAIPNALVTVCMDGNCITKASVWSDAGLSVPVANPQKTDGQGRFGFWALAGSYFYKVVLPSGALVGIYPITLGGSGGGGGGINQLGGDVFAGPGTGFVNATLATVNASPGACGDATHVCAITTDLKGRTIAQAPVAIAAGGGSVGSLNQFQVAGLTAGSFAAPPGIDYVFTGISGNLANGIQVSANFSGIPPLSTFLANIVGSQTSLATNAFFDGTNWVTQKVGASVNLRHPLSSSAIGISTLSVCPTLAAGATITGMNTTCVAEWTEYNASGPRTWFNSQLLSPTFPTNAALVLNPSANWFVDYSGNQTLNNLTINGTCTGCGAGGGVSSVVNSDGTLTISPTTGSVVASLALGHANTWTGAQTFTAPISAPSFSTTGATPGAASLAAGTGSIPALPANSAGLAAPVTGGTSYLLKLPATITAGIPRFGTPGTVDGVNESAMTAAELSGDATTSGSNAVTVVKVDGVAYPASPSVHTQPVVTASNTVTYLTTARSLGWSFGDAATGSTLTTTAVGYITVPFACTITGWHIMADAGTVTIKVARLNGGTALPTIANSINTSGVSLASGTKIDSTTLTDFTSTAIAANDTLGFFITTVATAKQVTFSIDCAQ